MAHLLLLTNTLAPSAEVVPALGLLSHHVRILPAEASVLVDAPQADVVIVDARRELAMAKSLAFARYDYRFEYGQGFHSNRHGRALLPDSLRWLWRDYKP